VGVFCFQSSLKVKPYKGEVKALVSTDTLCWFLSGFVDLKFLYLNELTPPTKACSFVYRCFFFRVALEK